MLPNKITARKLGLLGSLYFVQGLPFGFFTLALPVMMRQQGYSLGSIGLASLLAAPWALKFLWAPAVDRYGSNRLGHRRSWILPLQLATALAIGATAILVAPTRLPPLLVAVFVINALAATQDIATDGLAVDLLSPRERGLGNGLQVAGYRAGMVVGGGALLVTLEQLGWRLTLLIMAAGVVASVIPIALFRERPTRRLDGVGRSGSIRHFIRRPGAGRLLLLIGAYKVGDHLATGMLRPLLVDLGISLAEIGLLLGTVGFVAGLLGALLGGALVNRLGRRSALLAFGALQAISIGGFALLEPTTPPTLLYALCAAEHLAGGMATAALFTCMMDWCDPRSAATDYTVQASTVVLASGAAAGLSGLSAQSLGYANHFTLAAVIGLAAVAVVWALFPADRAAASECVPPAPIDQEA
jgi:PAT family beta-lactamase induction signal transducer AmpG